MIRKAAPDPASPPDHDALDRAAQQLACAAAETPAFQGATAQELIRHVAGKRIILRGTLRDQKVVFRIFLNGTEDCKRDWAELERAWPHMNTGDHRVAEPLAHAPATGVMAIEDVPGTPLLKWIYAAKPEDKATYLMSSAKWLRSYMDSSESDAEARPGPWAERAGRAAQDQAFNRLRRIERPVLAEIKRLVPHLKDRPWRFAIGHGDFHPNNLIVNGDRITGIDCGGSRAAPIYKDMARFLMHMGRRGVIPSGEAFLGVDKRGLDIFAEVFDLSAHDRTLTLPFFIAVEALLRTETRNLPEGRIRRARKMTEALLTDLQTIGR